MALTKFNYNSFDLTTAASKGLAFNSSANGFETAAEGSMTLIKTLTASSSANLTFVHGSSDVVLDSTYPIYLFKIINMHPATNSKNFAVNFRDGGSNYDASKTTTTHVGYHGEGAADSAWGYSNGIDLANSTSDQRIGASVGNGSDESKCGELYLFDPSSTTFVKHFFCVTSTYTQDNYAQYIRVGGYCNTTTAIDGVKFVMSSGDIDVGTFKLYGIKDS